MSGKKSSWVEPVLSRSQRHNAVPLVRLEPATPGLNLESSTLPLSHPAPLLLVWSMYSLALEAVISEKAQPGVDCETRKLRLIFKEN